MTKLFVASDLHIIKKHLEKEDDWIALIDNRPENIPENWKKQIAIVSELEREMFEFSEGAEQLNRQMSEWIKKWPDIVVMDGKSFKELVEYKKTSLWWFCETVIFRNTIKENYSFREIAIRLEAMKYLIGKHENVNNISIIGNNKLTGRCAVILAESLNIQLTGGKISKQKLNNITPTMMYYFKRIRAILRISTSKINKRKFKITKRVPIMGMSYIRHYLEHDTSIELAEKKKPTGLPHDSRLYNVLSTAVNDKKLKSRLMYIDRRYPFQLSTIKRLNRPAFPFELYGVIYDKKLNIERKRLLDTWKRLIDSPEFHESFQFKEFNIWPLMRNYFSFLFIKQFPETMECIDTMERAIAAEKPKVALISNETGFYGRALVLAARKKGVKTVGVQHGSISYLELEYDHSHEGETLACPVPDITALWGEKYKNILLEVGLYSESNVKVTGSPKYDFLSNASELYSRKKIINQFHIKQEKIVAVATQRFPVISEREHWLKAVVRASKEISGAFFIIKPHPGESTEMHKRICEKHGGNNIAVASPSMDTNEIIYSADLTVTCNSTVGLESLIFGTLLMSIDITGQKRKNYYTEYGASIGVFKEELILSEIKKALSGEWPPSLSTNMEKYVNEHAYKIDGRSSQRIVKILKELMEIK